MCVPGTAWGLPPLSPQLTRKMVMKTGLSKINNRLAATDVKLKADVKETGRVKILWFFPNDFPAIGPMIP